MSTVAAAPLINEVELLDMPQPSSTPPSSSSRHKIIAASTGSLITALTSALTSLSPSIALSSRTVTPFDVVKTRLQTQPAPLPLFETAHTLSSSRHFTPASDPPQPHASTSKVRLPATTNATCCQPTTFFGCRFDSTRNMSGIAVDALPRGVVTSFATGGSGQAMALFDAEAACAYPDAKAAKADLQRDPRRLNGMIDAVAKIVRHEGPAALWRGVGPALLMSVPTSAAYMVGYDALRASLLATTRPDDNVYRAGATLFAGGISRTIVVSIVSPLELLRTRLQSAHHSFQDVFASYRLFVKEQGPTSLWRGLPPTLWRDVPFSAIYWASYEFVRRGLTGGRGMGEMAQGESRSRAFGVAFVSGAVSGSVRSQTIRLAFLHARTDRCDRHEPVRCDQNSATGLDERRTCQDDRSFARAGAEGGC